MKARVTIDENNTDDFWWSEYEAMNDDPDQGSKEGD
jgi:hypothetical protein